MNVGLTTVYRSLAQFATEGSVGMVLDQKRGEHRYRLRRDGSRRWLVCRECWRAVEIDADRVEQWARWVGTHLGFVDVAVTDEIFGRCDHCHPTPD